MPKFFLYVGHRRWPTLATDVGPTLATDFRPMYFYTSAADVQPTSARRRLTTVVSDVGHRCIGTTLAHDRNASYDGVRPPADTVRSKYDVGLRMGYVSVSLKYNANELNHPPSISIV